MTLRKLLVYLTATSLLLVGSLILLVVNPGLVYAHKTELGNYTLYHNTTIDPFFSQRLKQANQLIGTSEFADPNVPMTICLNDQSVYPALIGWLQGPAFGYSFGDIVVIGGQTNSKRNYTQVNGYNWNLTALLAHEMTHCLQVHALGMLASNPVANHPRWKWEGYAEYVARQQPDQQNLQVNIDRWVNNQQSDSWGLYFSDKTYAPKAYYTGWLLVQYCLRIRQMSYRQVLADSTPESVMHQRMMLWYRKQALTKPVK
jgi:hypothetical protein